jgi:DNA-binding phage protein
MALTRDFKETVQRRAQRDPEFRRALLASAINELVAGDYDVAKAVLRDYINATITFPVLAQQLGKSAKSIHRMLGPGGNPRMDSMAGILKVLQHKENVRFHAKCSTAASPIRKSALLTKSRPQKAISP